jgi:diguanylate cyclase (GGDEF)-like protein
MEQAVQLRLRNTAPPRHARRFFAYVTVVVILAVAALAVVVFSGGLGEVTLPAAFWVTAVLAVVVDTRPFMRGGRRDRVPVFPSICYTFAILLAWGFGPAVLVQTAAVIGAALWLRHRPWRVAFNAGQYLVAFAAAHFVLCAGGVEAGDRIDFGSLFWMVMAGVTWFVVNNMLVATAVWLRFDGRWSKVFARGLRFDALTTGALLLSAPSLVAGLRESVWLAPVSLVSLLAVTRMAHLAADRARAARLDPLTGLANRAAVERTVADWLVQHADRAATGAPERRLALLLLDLDGFKQVNDALGHAVGDRLLIEVGRRLIRAVRVSAAAAHTDRTDEFAARFGGDLVARLGGDEFAIVVPGLRDVAGARRRAAEIIEALTEPVRLDGLPLDVSGSIGVAVYPEHGTDAATLMQHADVAMYDAKARGDSLSVYAPESDHNSPERLGLLADLRLALESPDGTGIEMYYQPQIEISTGAVVGVEALLRWSHPDRGQVDPEELIRVAEHSAVMRLLTFRVIDEVIAQLASWGPAAEHLRVAVNVSVRDLHTGEIADRIAERLSAHGVGPERLELEITESALMADPRRVLATLARLKRLGVAMALDDFGTGYSSMLHLRRLPLAEVKIDRSFVLGVATDPDDAAIVRSMIDLARALGLRVVAEGVEDERTWRMLVQAGCDVAQGWFFARPMPGDELTAWLARYQPRVAQQVGATTGGG